jgi:hypothetical protein
VLSISSSQWSPAPTITESTIPLAGWWRPLARSGLTVSALCLGDGAPLRPRSQRTSAHAVETLTLVHQAMAHQITFLDTMSSGARSSRRIAGAGAIADSGGQHGSVIVAITVDTHGRPLPNTDPDSRGR